MPGRWCTQSPASTSVSWSPYMNLAQPLVMITTWNVASCRCQPVPFSGAWLAFTRCTSTLPCVASATPMSWYRKKSRRPSLRQGLSAGLTWLNRVEVAVSMAGLSQGVDAKDHA